MYDVILSFLMCLLLAATYTWWPWCCCDTDIPPCDNCTADGNPLAVMIENAGGVLCSFCAAWFDGGTHAVYRTDAHTCTWTTGLRTLYCDALGFCAYRITAAAKVLAPGSNMGWEVTFEIWGPGRTREFTMYRWDSGGTADIDCTATRVASYYTSTPAEDAICSNWDALTVTVNP